MLQLRRVDVDPWRTSGPGSLLKKKRRQEEGERRQRREGSSEGEKAKGKEEKGFGPQHLSPTIATLS